MKDWVTQIIQAMGPAGIGFLMFAENLFPPLPSEYIMPLAGYMSAQGDMNLVWVILFGSLGSVLGAIFWYWVGSKAGAHDLHRWTEKHGIWIGLQPADLDRAEHFFHKHGTKAVLLGRLVPLIRTFISVPAGISGMPFTSFLLFTAVGTVVWTAALGCGGYFLGQQFPKISEYLGPVTWVIIAIAVVAYVVRVTKIARSRER